MPFGPDTLCLPAVHLFFPAFGDPPRFSDRDTRYTRACSRSIELVDSSNQKNARYQLTIFGVGLALQELGSLHIPGLLYLVHQARASANQRYMPGQHVGRHGSEDWSRVWRNEISYGTLVMEDRLAD